MSAETTNAARIYVTYNRFDHSILYVGSDREAALDAKQMTDDITTQRDVVISQNGDDVDVKLILPSESNT